MSPCRNCGNVFCASCCDQKIPVPSQQLFEPSRVCKSCYGSLHLGSVPLDLEKPIAASSNWDPVGRGRLAQSPVADTDALLKEGTAALHMAPCTLCVCVSAQLTWITAVCVYTEEDAAMVDLSDVFCQMLSTPNSRCTQKWCVCECV